MSIVANDENTQNDKALFQEMMEGVKPLPEKKSGKRRVPPPSSPRSQTNKPTGKTQTSTPTSPPTHAYTEREFASDVTANESLFFTHSGLQHREQRRLRQGAFPIEASLDLHGDTIEEAGHRLDEFLHIASNTGQRCVHIIHGKGLRSANGRAVLKSQLSCWLRDTATVMAFCSAQARHGGTGAIYVLLRRRP